jgi:hypothetical protein
MCFCVTADALCGYALTDSHSYSQFLPTDGADFNDHDMCILLHVGQIHSTGEMARKTFIRHSSLNFHLIIFTSNTIQIFT